MFTVKIKYIHIFFYVFSFFIIFFISSYYTVELSGNKINILNLTYEEYLELKRYFALDWVFFNGNDHYDYIQIIKLLFSGIKFSEFYQLGIRNDVVVSYIYFLLTPSIEKLSNIVTVLNYLILVITYYLHYNLYDKNKSENKFNIYFISLPILCFAFFVPHINKEIFNLILPYLVIIFLNRPSFLKFFFILSFSIIRIQYLTLIPILLFLLLYKRISFIRFFIILTMYFSLIVFFLNYFSIMEYKYLYIAELFEYNFNIINSFFYVLVSFIKTFYIYFNLNFLFDFFLNEKNISHFVFLLLFFLTLFVILRNIMIGKFNFSKFLFKDKNILFVIIMFLFVISISPVSGSRYVYVISPIIILFLYNLKKYRVKKTY